MVSNLWMSLPLCAHDPNRPGVLRWVGAVHGTGITHCGVELDVASGVHDGAIDGFRLSCFCQQFLIIFLSLFSDVRTDAEVTGCVHRHAGQRLVEPHVEETCCWCALKDPDICCLELHIELCRNLMFG